MNKEIILPKHIFYQDYKIPSNERVFFVSDLHYDHDRDFIWEARGYKNVGEMNETQIMNWNDTITNDDIVFHLGDFKFGRRVSYEDVLRRLNFKQIFLMPGNHYSGFQEIVDKMAGHCGYLLDGYRPVQPIPNLFEVVYRKQFIVLSHYPILSWNKVRRGSYNFFGHCHNTFKDTIGKQIDIGFDQFPIPQTFEDLKRILDRIDVSVVDGKGAERFFEMKP